MARKAKDGASPKKTVINVTADYEREINEYMTALCDKTGLSKGILGSCVLAYGLREITKNLKLDIIVEPSRYVNLADLLHQ